MSFEIPRCPYIGHETYVTKPRNRNEYEGNTSLQLDCTYCIVKI